MAKIHQIFHLQQFCETKDGQYHETNESANPDSFRLIRKPILDLAPKRETCRAVQPYLFCS